MKLLACLGTLFISLFALASVPADYETPWIEVSIHQGADDSGCDPFEVTENKTECVPPAYESEEDHSDIQENTGPQYEEGQTQDPFLVENK
jgi:hypothetical protein